MITARVWRIMDAARVEVTCWHGDGEDGSHLLLRQDVLDVLDAAAAVRAAADVVWACSDLAHRGVLDLTDDCGM